MASLRTQIQNCEQCELCKNMTVSPVAIEYFGEPPVDVLVVVGGPVKEHNDKTQEVITGVDRKIMIDIFKKLNLSFALTFLVKCRTEKAQYNKRDVLACDWIHKEMDATRPKVVVGMGNLKYSDVKYDKIYPSPSKVFENTFNQEWFISHLGSLINDKHV